MHGTMMDCVEGEDGGQGEEGGGINRERGRERE